MNTWCNLSHNDRNVQVQTQNSCTAPSKILVKHDLQWPRCSNASHSEAHEWDAEDYIGYDSFTKSSKCLWGYTGGCTAGYISFSEWGILRVSGSRMAEWLERRSKVRRLIISRDGGNSSTSYVFCHRVLEQENNSKKNLHTGLEHQQNEMEKVLKLSGRSFIRARTNSSCYIGHTMLLVASFLTYYACVRVRHPALPSFRDVFHNNSSLFLRNISCFFLIHYDLYHNFYQHASLNHVAAQINIA